MSQQQDRLFISSAIVLLLELIQATPTLIPPPLPLDTQLLFVAILILVLSGILYYYWNEYKKEGGVESTPFPD